MSVPILPVDQPGAAQRAAEVLAAGGLVILPTDTVYGVAAHPARPEAVAALYQAKSRPPDKAIPILLSDEQHALHVASEWPVLAQRLASAFWPGALTIVMPKRPDVPDIVSALPTIGLRVPDHDATRAVIRAAGGVLAVTSANRSGGPDSLTVSKAVEALGAAAGLVLDGGPCPGGLPSTVVDVSDEQVTILRAGPVSEVEIKQVASLGLN